MEKWQKVFAARAEHRMAKVGGIFGTLKVERVRLCGGGLMRKYNDLDFYPATAEGFPKSEDEKWKKLTISAQTQNAISIGGVQLCRHYKPTLEELVESFDFTHCQVGVELEVDKENKCWDTVEVFTTEAFFQAMATQTTEFTGSEYPLSSLVRLSKVASKLDLSQMEVARLTVATLAAVVDRGFNGDEDLKDQLDAIDLSILIGDLEGLEDATELIGRRLQNIPNPKDDEGE